MPLNQTASAATQIPKTCGPLDLDLALTFPRSLCLIHQFFPLHLLYLYNSLIPFSTQRTCLPTF